jgi:hypothetical protein
MKVSLTGKESDMDDKKMNSNGMKMNVKMQTDPYTAYIKRRFR